MKKTIMFGIIAFLILAMPFAIAQNNETVEIKGGKEYPLLERALDRIRLAFTLQIERKAALIEKIEQRRLEHYNFLVAKGKTEQAAKFNETTTGLIRNFDDWKARKLATVDRFENKSEEVRAKIENKTRTENETREKPTMNETRGRY